MPNYDGRHVIMLDGWMEVYPHEWPISKSSASLAAARKHGQCTNNPTLVSKSNYAAELIENKSLRDTSTGTIASGAIYLMTEREED